MMLSAGIEYWPSWRVLFNLGYQHNQFDGYDVNYLIAGLKIAW
jgi:hypothetical protein